MNASRFERCCHALARQLEVPEPAVVVDEATTVMTVELELDGRAVRLQCRADDPREQVELSLDLAPAPSSLDDVSRWMRVNHALLGHPLKARLCIHPATLRLTCLLTLRAAGLDSEQFASRLVQSWPRWTRASLREDIAISIGKV